MALSREVYQEIEDIVGSENVSDDLVAVEAYTAFGFGARGPEPMDRFYKRPEAVVLPGNTKEVQAIVRLCNRRGLQFKASSTGYGAFNALHNEGILFLDMRRMNRIIEIDAENMFAIVEPYVSFAELQGEAMRKGLNCHVIGAGSNASALASTTSVHGTNTQAVSMGWGGRNCLGVEWVLPTGEILKLGAPGSGMGWFSGDGPGPSLRGIMRGAAGATGGLGVFTKVAIHLHPWAGPAKMELKGVSPYYSIDIPPLFSYHLVSYPDWEKAADGQYKIGEAQIALAWHKTGGPGSAGPCMAGNNNEYYQMWLDRDELKNIPFSSFAIVMAANSETEHEYQEKTLRKILEDTGGSLMPLGEEHFWRDVDFITMIKACFIPRLAFRTAGAFCCPLQGSDSVDHSSLCIALDKEFRAPYDEKGLLFNDGVNGMWTVMFDGGHFSLFECGHMYSPTEADSWRAGAGMMQKGKELGLKMPFSSGWTLMGNDVVNSLGPRFNNIQNWQRKIKISFDPNTASDPSGYISPYQDESAGKEGGMSFGSVFPSLPADEVEDI